MTAIERDRQLIAAIIEQYRRGFATMDVEVLEDIWDQDYDNLIYIAQEAAEPVRGWTGIEQYYEGVAGFLGRVKTMTVSDLSVDVLGDVAYAFCIFQRHLYSTPQERSVEGDPLPRICSPRPRAGDRVRNIQSPGSTATRSPTLSTILYCPNPQSKKQSAKKSKRKGVSGDESGVVEGIRRP